MSTVLLEGREVSFIGELEFENLMAQALQVFTQIKIQELQSKMQQFLEHVRSLMDLDICNFYSFDQDTGLMSMSYATHRPGLTIYLQPEEFQNVPLQHYPFAASRLKNGRPVIIRTFKDLDPYSDSFLKFWQSTNVKSALYLPVQVENKVFGFFGFGNMRYSVNWSHLDISRLQMICNILANAFDRVFKTQEIEEVNDDLRVLRNMLRAENNYLRYELKKEHDFDHMVGSSKSFQNVIRTVKRIGPSTQTVVVQGEVGVGKELIARAVHSYGNFQEAPFVKVNCGNVSDDQPGSAIFCTVSDHRETIRVPEDLLKPGSTLFLDNIDALSENCQSGLFARVEGGWFKSREVRLIASTSKDLSLLVKGGEFRSDLYFHLNFFLILIPPLRERKDDIPELVTHLIAHQELHTGKELPSFNQASLQRLVDYFWPGNVRELKNVVERALLTSSRSRLKLDDRFKMKEAQSFGQVYWESLDSVNKKYITQVLQKSKWKIEGPGGASEILKINPSTLRSRIKKLGIRR